MEKVCIMGIEYANAPLSEIVDECISFTAERGSKMVVTPNGEIAEYAYHHEDFNSILKSADLIIPDGVSIIVASKKIGTPINQRVPGVETAQEIIRRLDSSSGSLFLFGGAPGVADEAAENITKEYPNIRIAGTENGYFEDDAPIVKKINAASPDVLFVCLGSPKQEMWMSRNREKLSCGVMLGLGGTLDVLAGRVKRAPAIFCKLGCEWLYRTVKQPSRIFRVMKIPRFVFRCKRIAKKEAKRLKNEG